ncbi:MAG: hypothetical protein JSW10_07195, partial [Pseudomonadota bacterium]
ADAMTVEAVPHVDADGQPIDTAKLRLMHTTMQTLGRVAIVGGGIIVNVVTLVMFEGIDEMVEAEKLQVYVRVYELALLIPLISVAGVMLGGLLKARDLRRLHSKGIEWDQAWKMIHGHIEKTTPNWWILGGSLVFVVFTLSMGLSNVPYNQEIIFAGSMIIVLFLMSRLMRVLEPQARRVLVGTAVIIFVYRAMPTPGVGETWWMMDELGFNEQFLTLLELIAGALALLGMFIFRRFMAEKSIAYVMVFLTVVATVLYLPIVGMYYGLHEWTASITNGVVDAEFIALVNTALESPLGQVAMIPMLAWIANSAPANLKATFFAVMASFTNLALSLAQLGTKYLNEIYVVSREVRDPVTDVVIVAQDYSEMGMLLVAATTLTFVLPIAAVLLVKGSPLKSA